MSNYHMLTIPIDRETVGAARRLRSLISDAAGADLCAGVSPLSVDTVERIHTAVAGLYFQTQELLEIARGERVIIAPGVGRSTGCAVVFDVVDRAGQLVGAIQVSVTNAGLAIAEAEDVRRSAVLELAEQATKKFAAFGPVWLSHAPGRVVQARPGVDA